MRLAGALAAVAALGCSTPRTEVVVVVANGGVQIPGDIDALELHATDRSAGMPVFDSPRLTLCPTDGTSRPLCKALPIVLTLVPGGDHPDDAVRVEADALVGDTVAITDAASFSFTPQASLEIDFVLYPRCVGVDCGSSDQACDPSGACRPTVVAPFSGEPPLDQGVLPDATVVDLAATPFDAALPDGATDDLPLPDLSLADLAGGSVDLCVQQQCNMNYGWCRCSCSCVIIQPPTCCK
jgi:hypothetical protein